ncbi:MAG: terminase small subunit [Clostridia bacterium]|nr:terminase small subunit [Clostridia bacterium]
MTEKQKRFCDEYLIDLNATRAYKVAYPRTKQRTAEVNGSKLLSNTEVKEYIELRLKDIQKRTEVTQDKVIQELAAIAFTNATEFASVKGNSVIIKDTDTLEENVKKAIIGIKEGKNGIEIKSADKVQALELLGRHLGMFKDKLEISKSTGEITAEIDKYIQERMNANDQ